MAEQYDSLLSYLSTPIDTLQNKAATSNNMNEVENIRNDSVSELRASFLPIINH